MVCRGRTAFGQAGGAPGGQGRPQRLPLLGRPPPHQPLPPATLAWCPAPLLKPEQRRGSRRRRGRDWRAHTLHGVPGRTQGAGFQACSHGHGRCFPAPGSLPAPGRARLPLLCKPPVERAFSVVRKLQLHLQAPGVGNKCHMPHAAAGLRLTASAHSTGGQGMATGVKAAQGSAVSQHGPGHHWLRPSWQGRWQQMLRPRQWLRGFPGPSSSQTPGCHPLGFSHVAGIPPETGLLGLRWFRGTFPAF